MRSGRPFKPWDSRPRVAPHLQWVLAAFRKLGSCRAAGMTIGPIPWTATHRWARANGVLNRERFEYLVEKMDDAFLELVHKTDEKKQEKPGG